MVALGDILIVFLATLCYDYAYSVSSITITDVGDLNFVVSWEPVENYTGMYNLTKDLGSKILCYTNATSCFLGGKLLEDNECPLIHTLIVVTLEVEGREIQDTWLLNNVFRVGPPDILSSDIEATNITIVIRGGQTPLYYDTIHKRCRGESWKGQKLPLYMGQKGSKDVMCNYSLTDSSGSRAIHELKNFYGRLSEESGELHIFLNKLKPFSNYSISLWCSVNNEDSRSKVYDFTTKEDVPSIGPTIEKPGSDRLGCDEPELRNITFTIKPPPEDQRRGILLFYEICYRVVTTNQEEWQSEILELSSPPPDSTEVTLDNISRWDAYEVKVFGNNSVGGMSSSVHQFEVLKLNQVQSQPQNVTTKEIREGVWLLKWDHPWSPHTGDCIINYEISTEEKLLGTTNTTSYIIDTNVVGAVYKVKITPMIYNGTRLAAFRGSELSTDVMSRITRGLSQTLFVIISILLAVFIFSLIGCTYLCLQHGPRWTQPLDISNNSVLKAAFAMGDIRPKIPEREEFDTLASIPPPSPPPPADDGEDEMGTIVPIDAPPAGRAGRDAVPHPPIPDHSPSHSTEGSLSEDCDHVVAMEMEVENAPVAFSSSSSVNDHMSRGTGLQSLLPSGSNLNTSCSEDSLGPLPRYPSPTDSGYVQSPPPHQISNQAKPVEDSGYFRFDYLRSIPCRVVIDNGKQERSCDDAAILSCPKYTDSGYVAGTMTEMSSASTYSETTPLQGEYYMMNATRKQSSIDSEDTVTFGSLSPSDSEMGDGVGSYTKLSHPNTPLSPRSNAVPVGI